MANNCSASESINVSYKQSTMFNVFPELSYLFCQTKENNMPIYLFTYHNTNVKKNLSSFSYFFT